MCPPDKAYKKADRDTGPSKASQALPGLLKVELPSAGLGARKLTLETCKKWSYGISEDKNGMPVQVAQYRDRSGRIVAQKLRYADKSKFPWVGSPKEAGLFGMHLWGKGKYLTITEGEIDALSVSQAQGNRWPVVSLPNGAASARKDLMKHLDYLENFAEIVLCFDNDEPGQNAARDCAEALLPMKVRICTLPLKDANEMLKQGRGDELPILLMTAPEFTPEGILDFDDLEAEALKDPVISRVQYPYVNLNNITRGLRRGELVTVTAGSGVGKSAFVRELVYKLKTEGENVGVLMLEESAKRTVDGLVGLHMNKTLHISREGISVADISKAFRELKTTGGKLKLFDHFGSTEIEKLLARIRYMVKAQDCGWIVLDHLSIVVSGLEVQDERRAIDMAMTMLRTLVQDTGIGMILVSHLKRADGNKGHEQGAEVSLGQLRGSQAIAQLSDIVIGLERNQQGEAEERNQTTVRVLKNRFTGETGVAGVIVYDPETGRLKDKPEFSGEF